MKNNLINIKKERSTSPKDKLPPVLRTGSPGESIEMHTENTAEISPGVFFVHVYEQGKAANVFLEATLPPDTIPLSWGCENVGNPNFYIRNSYEMQGKWRLQIARTSVQAYPEVPGGQPISEYGLNLYVYCIKKSLLYKISQLTENT